MTAQDYLEERKVDDIACGVREDGEFLLMSDMMNEYAFATMNKNTSDLIQFVAFELRGEKLSEEDVESIIHDYIHPKK